MSRRGASRKSSALRVGGVSTTTRSKCVLVVQLVELLHRHVLLRARQRAGDVAVEAVGQDALGLLGGLGVLDDQVVERGLGVEHQRPELARPTVPSMRLGVFDSDSSPRASASRLAGSMVTTHVRAALAGPPSRAMTAAVVVLPTPPEPVQTMTSCSRDEPGQLGRARRPSAGGPAGRRAHAGAGQLGQAADAGEQPVGQHVDLGRSQVGVEQVGQARAGAAAAARPAGRSARPAAPCGGGGTRRRRPAPRPRPRAGTAPAVGGGDRGVGVEPGDLRVEAVDDDRAEADADLVLEAVGGLDQLVDRRLLGQRHQHHLAPLRVGQQVEHVTGLGVDRPDPHGVEQPAGRAQEADGVARRPGRRARSGRPRRFCSSCLTLPRMRMSLMPGAAVATMSTAPLDTSRREMRLMPWSSRYSSRASSGVRVRARHVGRPVGTAAGRQRDLLVVERRLAEQGGQAALALDLDDQRGQPGQRRRPGQGGADGGFAHAALPGHDDHARCCEELRRIHPFPFGGT